MKNRGEIVLVVVLLIVLYSSFAYADVFLVTPPESNYNLGDTMGVTLGSDSSEGWAGVNLVCGNQSKMLYFKYITQPVNDYITAPINKNFLKGMMGQCHLSLDFNGQAKQSFAFTVTNAIEVKLSTSGDTFNPGENFNFQGSVAKPNGKPVSGNANLKFSGSNLDISVPIINDQFSGNITLPSNVPAGSYSISVYVSEKDATGDVTNFGSSNSSISVKQLPTKLELSLDKKGFPGKEFKYKSVLYDQTEKVIPALPVSYKITDVSGRQAYDGLVETDKDQFFLLAKNAPFGDWQVVADSEGISSQATIYIEQHKEAEFVLLNNRTLTVRNIGNVPYDRKVEVKIGNETIVRNLNISEGGSVQFDLTAPDGEYSVGISDGDATAEWTGVPLTGNAISIDGAKFGKFGFFNRTLLAWLFILGVLGLFIFLTSKKIINKNVFLNSNNKNLGNIKEPEKKVATKLSAVSSNAGNLLIEADDGTAHYSSVIDGTKQLASLVATKIKNNHEILSGTSNAKEVLKDISRVINDNGGRVYKNDDFIIGIFAPITTKKMNNEMTAVKVARIISDKLKTHNDKFTQKINFGIAVNSGDIITKRDSGRLLFNALGTTLSSVKKATDFSSKNILLCEDAYKRVMSQVKTTPNLASGALKTYLISDVIDRERNSKFIENFLQRNQEYKSLRDYRSGKLDDARSKSYGNTAGGNLGKGVSLDFAKKEDDFSARNDKVDLVF